MRTGEEMAMSQNRGTPGTLSHSWLMDGSLKYWIILVIMAG